MSKKRKKNSAWWLFGCLAAAALIGSAIYVWRSGFRPTETVFLYIDEDDDLDSVCQKIEAVGNPTDMNVFRLYATVLNLKDHINTGRYEVTPDKSMLRLVRNIRNHNESPMMLVVPSVRTLNQMAGRLAHQLMVDSASIAQYLSDDANIEDLGYTKESLPGLFIPNTYEVYWDVSTEKLIKRMQKEHAVFWNDERMNKIQDVSRYANEEMTKEKVITLASIVDSETSYNPEKPTIAALYMNRMRKGMMLQSDPTVIFALKDFSIKRVRGDHLKVESPYNTYRYKGLPPGPIRVPSIAGIDAVLNHAKNDYIYMCAKEDFSGTHNYAVNYAEHQKNAAKYVRALNARNIH